MKEMQGLGNQKTRAAMNEDRSKLIEAEFSEIEINDGWARFFQGIKSEMNSIPFEITEAKKLQNRKFNRYQDVNPYNHSRIILKNSPVDYINASLVSVEKADRKYILAQGPLSHTTPHFWQMIWQEDSRAIIMLNRIFEKNVNKCHQYWPLPDEDAYIFNDVGLKITYLSQEKASYYTVTKLRVENLTLEESREVVHFHYTTWPDFGCPQSPTAFLKFLALVRASGALDRSDQPPVVHCSAGIGRSGTFCLVDTCLRLIKDVNLDNVIVRNVLIEMRHFRMGLVQTADQLRFSYLAIIEGLKKDITINGSLELEQEEEVEEEEAPPPVPPPRTESLTTRIVESDELRQRKKEREDRKERISDKIKEVTEKMKDSEDSNKGNPLSPVLVIALLVGGCVLTYWMYRG